MSSFRICLLFTLAMCGGIAHADIYRYVNPEGVTTFTNIRPTGRYEVVIKEKVAPVAEVKPAAATAQAHYPVRGYAAATRSRYASQIQTAAHAARIDPALVHAVISAESGYNPSAKSRAGAVGLMQLMPETAARYSVTNRWDPEQNIQGGTRYLSDLLRMFNNDLRLALAAYNAGEHTVVRYGNRIPPYRETVAYVPKVIGFYQTYRTGL